MRKGEGEVALPALMDVKEVCEYLGLHRVTVVEFARLGKLPAFKVGREWRFRADEIRAWLDSQRPSGRAGGKGDGFEELWRRVGEKAAEGRVTPEDIPYVVGEVRGTEVHRKDAKDAKGEG